LIVRVVSETRHDLRDHLADQLAMICGQPIIVVAKQDQAGDLVGSTTHESQRRANQRFG